MSYEKPNYTQIPNALLDEHMPNMSPAEFKIVAAIARQTFGWQRSSVQLSIPQLEKMTGMSRQTVSNALQDAIERGVVTRVSNGQWYIYALKIQSVGGPTEPYNGDLKQSRNHTGIESKPVQNLDPSRNHTSLETRLVDASNQSRNHTGFDIEPVQKLDGFDAKTSMISRPIKRKSIKETSLLVSSGTEKLTNYLTCDEPKIQQPAIYAKPVVVADLTEQALSRAMLSEITVDPTNINHFAESIPFQIIRRMVGAAWDRHQQGGIESLPGFVVWALGPKGNFSAPVALSDAFRQSELYRRCRPQSEIDAEVAALAEEQRRLAELDAELVQAEPVAEEESPVDASKIWAETLMHLRSQIPASAFTAHFASTSASADGDGWTIYGSNCSQLERYESLIKRSIVSVIGKPVKRVLIKLPLIRTAISAGA